MKPHPECPKVEADLTAFLTGDLPAARAAAVRGHLARCESCRASAQELATTLDLLRGALAASPSVPERLDPARRAAVLAARPSRATIWLDAWLVPLARAAIFIIVPALILVALMMPAMNSSHRAAKLAQLDRLEAETAAAGPFGTTEESSGRRLETDRSSGPADPFASAPGRGAGGPPVDAFYMDFAGKNQPAPASATPALQPAEAPALGDAPVLGRLMRGSSVVATPAAPPSDPGRPAEQPPAPSMTAAPAKAAPAARRAALANREGEELTRDIPKPAFVGTPVSASVPNLEPAGTPQPRLVVGEPMPNIAAADAARTGAASERKLKEADGGWAETGLSRASVAGAAGAPPSAESAFAKSGSGSMSISGGTTYFRDAERTATLGAESRPARRPDLQSAGQAPAGPGAGPAAAEPALEKANAGALVLNGAGTYSGGAIITSGSALREKGQAPAAAAEPLDDANGRMTTKLYAVQPSVTEIVTTRPSSGGDPANRGEFITMGGASGAAADTSYFSRQVEAAREAGARARRALADGKTAAGDALDVGGVAAGQKPAPDMAADDTVVGLKYAVKDLAEKRDKTTALGYGYVASDKKTPAGDRWETADARRSNRAPVDELQRKSETLGLDTDRDGTAAPNGAVHAGAYAFTLPANPEPKPQSELGKAGEDVAKRADMEKELEDAPAKPADTAIGNKLAEAPVPALAIMTGDEKQATAEPTFKPAGFNPVVEAAENAFSTFSIDVDTASYTMARRSILDGKRPEPESVRTEEFVNAFDYDYAPPSKGAFAIHVDGASSPFRTSMDVLRIGIKGRRIGRDQHVPSNLTLVIDTSGSMQTDDRIGLIRRSLRMLVDQLDPEDRVAVVQFGSKAALRLEPTPAAQKDEILRVIDSLETVGSTQLEGGLKLGYEVAARAFRSGASNRVILMSDGVANLGATEAAGILSTVEAHRKQGVRLTVLGFGTGAYDDAMLESLADKGDGAYTFIDSEEEARRVLVDNLAATLHVIASDVKIQVEFNPRRVQRWRQLGYENRALTKEQFRDDMVDAGEVGSGQSVTALYDVQLDGSASEWIGTVRVRYRDVETGRVEEIERRITARDFTRDFAAASPRFRLAAGVAELAELLRLSPHTFSQGRDLADALAVLRPVALELSIDPQVQELVRLAQAAQSLPY